MPIKPENKRRYPKEWPLIVARIRERAGNKCEKCGVPNSTKALPVFRNTKTGEWTRNALQAEEWTAFDGDKVSKIVCTTAHLDHVPEHCEDDNLLFLCQKCHLAYDKEHHMTNSRNTRREGKAVDMFEITQEKKSEQ